jgi:hypothetical protein
MSAAITERFAYQGKPRATDPLSKIRAKLCPPDPRRLRAEIVLLVYLPPWIEDSATRRIPEQVKEGFDWRHEVGMAVSDIDF